MHERTRKKLQEYAQEHARMKRSRERIDALFVICLLVSALVLLLRRDVLFPGAL